MTSYAIIFYIIYDVSRILNRFITRMITVNYLEIDFTAQRASHVVTKSYKYVGASYSVRNKLYSLKRDISAHKCINHKVQ